jgi:benzodiazapine receptor
VSTLLGRRSRPIVTAALSAVAVATLGGLITKLGVWYYQLRKPTWQPPDWLFGPAWTVIFACAALAAVIFWRHEFAQAARSRVIAAFAVNASLNVLWSLLFFRLERPDWALYEVGFLWLSILALIILLGRTSNAAAWLLAPYLAWVSFASVLNWKIVQLNAPFLGNG